MSSLEDTEQSILTRFEHIAAKYPNNIALKTKNSATTYDELNKAANRLKRATLVKCRKDDKPRAPARCESRRAGRSGESSRVATTAK